MDGDCITLWMYLIQLSCVRIASCMFCVLYHNLKNEEKDKE